MAPLAKDDDEAAPTTRAYYLTSQRMREKADGMRAWSEALVEAYLKAGGAMPAPKETNRRSKIKQAPRSESAPRSAGTKRT
jgi:hypothetical protein